MTIELDAGRIIVVLFGLFWAVVQVAQASDWLNPAERPTPRTLVALLTINLAGWLVIVRAWG